MNPNSLTYQKAFQRYLRYGISIETQMKSEEHFTTHYIWVTMGDEKVRPEHAANAGLIFSWDAPPATGHPGFEPGCRCIAVPYESEPEYPDAIEPWYPELILLPLFRLGGRAVRLAAGALRRSTAPKSPAGFTEHAIARAAQRGISTKDIQSAMQSARQTGNIATKTGKYGNPQLHYKGSNGVTVV